MGKAIFNFWEGTDIALRALLSNKTRSLLTTLGIVIGVVTVTLMLMIIQGLNRSFQRQIAFLGSNTIYVNKWPWVITDGSWWKYINRPPIRMEDYEYVRQHSELAEYVAAGLGTRRTIGYRDELREGVEVNGACENYTLASGFAIDVGRGFTTADVRSARKVCLIGTDVQSELFKTLNPVGRRIRIGNDLYRVVGILEPRGTTFGESMDNRVVIPVSTFENVFGRRRSVQIVVKAKSGVDLDALEDEVTFLMRKSRRLMPREENNFVINRQEMLEGFYRQITAGVYAAGLVIGGIALLVGGVGIMNIMLVSVAERTWEIGMRKAVGARTTNILFQFLVEAMLICMVGGAIGLALAALAGQAIKSQLPVSLPLWLSVMAVLFSAVVGLVFGLFPAAKAARMDPIVALRQE